MSLINFFRKEQKSPPASSTGHPETRAQRRFRFPESTTLILSSGQTAIVNELEESIHGRRPGVDLIPATVVSNKASGFAWVNTREILGYENFEVKPEFKHERG